MKDTGAKTYIKVTVPMKLDWNPTFSVPEELRGRLSIGDRVKVKLGSKTVDAVVCETEVTPDISPDRIKAIEGINEGLEKISAEEISLWTFISEYYLCTQGEVFRCAYPSGKIRSEETASRVSRKADACKARMREACLLRLSGLEAEITAIGERYSKELSSLSEKAVKTRERLTAKRDERIERLNGMILKLKARLESLDSEPDQGQANSPVPNCPDTDRYDIKALPEGLPVLAEGSLRERNIFYREIISKELSEGHTVLMLVPEIGLTEEYEREMTEAFGESLLIFHSKESTARRRKIADALRSDGAHLLIGTRSAIFLPFRNLSLILVDEEQDRSYKQDSPAPRYNARDCAVVLAKIHSSKMVLGSSCPSLETIFNCDTGRYKRIILDSEGPSDDSAVPEVIDTVAEKRKNGMVGQFSRRLLAEISDCLGRGGKVYLIRLWGDTSQTCREIAGIFPEVTVSSLDSENSGNAGIIAGTLRETKYLEFAEGSLLAILQADPILSAQTFRTDERALQLIERYRQNCAKGRFIIQTGRSEHPIFKEMNGRNKAALSMLQERKTFSYPPFSRFVDLVFCDNNSKRLEFMAGEMVRFLYSRPELACKPALHGNSDSVLLSGPYPLAEGKMSVRISLPKDKHYSSRKFAIKQAVAVFEKEKKYSGFIHTDVDPE